MNGIHGRGAGVPKIVRGVRDADDKLVTLVKERPVVAICAAMAVGYLVGRVLTKLG